METPKHCERETTCTGKIRVRVYTVSLFYSLLFCARTKLAEHVADTYRVACIFSSGNRCSSMSADSRSAKVFVHMH